MTPQVPLDSRPQSASLQAYSRLLHAHAAGTRLLGAALQHEHGLTVSEYEALAALARADERRLRRVDLAGRLVLSPSGVTRLLEGLEGAGLVERVACPTDLRVTYARLTDAGAERLAAAEQDHRRAVAALFEERLETDEVEELARLLGALPGVGAADEDCPAG